MPYYIPREDGKTQLICVVHMQTNNQTFETFFIKVKHGGRE